MQLTFSCVPGTFCGIEKALSAARLGRYLVDAKGDRNYALRLYVWNARLCEALYLPTQICEIVLRNAIHKALSTHHGDNWHERAVFLCTLPRRLRDELDAVIRSERDTYGAAMTVNHVVSGLSFGFWLHLLTKNYEGVLWPTFFPLCFPNKPAAKDRQSLYDMADQFRIHRNRIAHHKPVFDKSPNIEYANLRELVSWTCKETEWFMHAMSLLAQTIGQRPQH